MAWKSIQFHVKGSSQLVNPSHGARALWTCSKSHKGANGNIDSPSEHIPCVPAEAEGLVSQEQGGKHTSKIQPV